MEYDGVGVLLVKMLWQMAMYLSTRFVVGRDRSPKHEAFSPRLIKEAKKIGIVKELLADHDDFCIYRLKKYVP